MSPATPLFLPSPNRTNNTGLNREKFVVNPSATTAQQLKMFHFVGVLMGAALRTKFTLPLDLPSLVWKQIVGESPTETDLESVDKLCLQALRGLDSLSAEELQDLAQPFTTQLSSGAVVNLLEDGAGAADAAAAAGSAPLVTKARVKEFKDLVIKARLRESTQQVNAIRKGFNAIVPLGMLSLFTWHEVELLVCGDPDIDVDALKRHTTYRGGLSKSHPVVKNLFLALKSFNAEERRLFLRYVCSVGAHRGLPCMSSPLLSTSGSSTHRFVWGRNRLPNRDADWTQPFTINSLPASTCCYCASHTVVRDANTPCVCVCVTAPDESGDGMLPISHTCFFSLDLPMYSTYEALRSKVLFAIVNCQAIDTDFNPNDSSISTWLD